MKWVFSGSGDSLPIGTRKSLRLWCWAGVGLGVGVGILFGYVGLRAAEPASPDSPVPKQITPRQTPPVAQHPARPAPGGQSQNRLPGVGQSPDQLDAVAKGQNLLCSVAQRSDELEVLSQGQDQIGAGARGQDRLVLAENGQSAYQIVIPEKPSPSVEHAAKELQHFLAEMTGAKLPIRTDAEPLPERAILLGQNRHLQSLGVPIDFAGLGNEGYHLRTVGPHLVIAGSSVRGTLYGVYALLDDHLGCRWFAPGVSRIPKYARLELGPLDERYVPPLEYREVFTFECFDGDWAARNRVNSSSARLGPQHGGKVRFADGFFVHTFERLVPPDKYFDQHPEYFSLVKGKRLRQHSQLCCTNEEVIRLCTEAIRQAMRQQPDATVFSVSQNDWYNYCECERCQALAKAEESQMAPVLALVNRVAEAVEKEFPDKLVETLAYQWTRKPPKTLRPRQNVIIRLCSIECCFSHPLATCESPANAAFRRDIEGWSKICHRLWVWDYVTDFRHYLLPFPNQRVRQPNIQFFVAHHVTGIFEQDTYNTPHSELAALGGYLTAKFLWNPQYDPQKALQEFLEGYYGKAAELIRAYLDLLHDHVEKHRIHVNIWAHTDSPHLPDQLLLEADRLWQKAEERTADQPEVQQRVRLSRMSVDYAIVERARLQRTKAPDSPICQLARQRFQPFIQTLEKSGLTHLHEHRQLDLAEYRSQLAAALGLQP